MTYLIEDFIADSNAASTREEAFALYRKAIANLGFDSAVYTFVTDNLAAGQRAGHGVQCNFPQDWMQYYQERGYNSIDPVGMYVVQNTPVFTWDHLLQHSPISDRQKNILRESAEAGLNNGVGIGLFGKNGEIAGVGLASSHKDKLEPDRNLLSKVKLITEQFHLVYCALSTIESNDFEKPHLTPRELEVLKWWAEGKSSTEIGMILHCTEASVRFHLKNVYRKLDANTKITAITKAIRLNLISPSRNTYTDG